jgi:rod shape-determining protein MreC
LEDFFKSRRFQVLALLLALVFAFALRAAYADTAIPMLSRITGWLLTPVQRVTAQISYGVGDFFSDYLSAPRLAAENDALRGQNALLRGQLIELERFRAENEQLREYLEIKDKHPDFDFEPAMVIGRDAADRFYSFTIDKGRSDGISVNDPVITAEGLAGIVSEVGVSHAKVLTILDVTVEVGAMDVITREIGVTSGDIALAQQGALRLSYLPRDSAAQAGDLVATTGIGGLFPRELVIGVIREVVPDGRGLSLYAVVEPPADLRTVRDVLVIRHFEGQATADNP